MTKRLIAEHANASGLLLNPAGFVDFSTEPIRLTHNVFPFLIVDVSWTLSRYMSFGKMQVFYRKFPLHDIIANLLSQSINMSLIPNEMEHMAYATEDALDELIERVRPDELSMFYERLSQELEDEINAKAPMYRHSGDYVFYRWVDRVSLCLCLDVHDIHEARFRSRFSDF